MEQTARLDNLKRGVGGTVDVEFVSQALTLRHLRQFPQIRRVGTTDSLLALVKAGCIHQQQADTLIDGYRFLRRVEGNLRLMNTAARHELPDDAHQKELLAFLMNENEHQVIVDLCEAARSKNREVFQEVFDALSNEGIS